MGVLIEIKLNSGVYQFITLGFDRDRVIAGEQVHENCCILFQRITLLRRMNTKHGSIRGQRPWPQAKHNPTTCKMIQHRKAICDPEWIVIRQRNNACAKPDVFCLRRDMRNEHHRITNRLCTARVMLTNPCFIKPDTVHQLHNLGVALQRIGRIVIHR